MRLSAVYNVVLVRIRIACLMSFHRCSVVSVRSSDLEVNTDPLCHVEPVRGRAMFISVAGSIVEDGDIDRG